MSNMPSHPKKLILMNIPKNIVIISHDYITACRFKTLLHTHMDNVA